MQYTLAIKTLDGLKELVKLLKKENYDILHGLDNVNDDEKIVGVCIDLNDKTFFRLNVTCMVCWSGGTRRPLYCEEMVQHFQRLIVDKDYDYYNELVKEASEDEIRPVGLLLSPDVGERNA